MLCWFKPFRNNVTIDIKCFVSSCSHLIETSQLICTGIKSQTINNDLLYKFREIFQATARPGSKLLAKERKWLFHKKTTQIFIKYDSFIHSFIHSCDSLILLLTWQKQYSKDSVNLQVFERKVLVSTQMYF